MWPTALTRPHGRASTRRATHRRSSRTLWALEDRLTALRHNRTRRRGGCRPHRRLVNRARSRLWHDQPARRSRRRCVYWRRPGTRWSRAYIGGLHQSSGTYGWYCLSCGRAKRRRSRGRRSCLQCCWCFGCWSFGRQNCGSCVLGDRRLLFGNGLSRLCRFCGGARLGSRTRWRLGRNDDGSRRTCHRLRRDEPWRGLRSFNRSCRLRAGCYGGRGLRRSNRGTRGSRRRRRRSRTRRRSRLSSLLRDRLKHITRLGDVRQVDLGLKLVRRRRRRAGGTA